jgi:SAM-dependent methyltransferase
VTPGRARRSLLVEMGTAAKAWAQALSDWVIPPDILAAAPESPWGFPPRLFGVHGGERTAVDTPSHHRAMEILPEGGEVIDVGVGGGRSSLALARRAGLLTGVDESESMLAAFARAAEGLVAHREVLGRWPDVAPAAGTSDIVVCHHVFYNVADLVPFATALTAAARRRVVVELTTCHPWSTLNDLWRHFHGMERPTGPTDEDAEAVLAESGIEARRERWRRPTRHADAPRKEVVAFVRRRLCLGPEHEQEIDELLGESPVWSPTEVATLWWDGGAEA